MPFSGSYLALHMQDPIPEWNNAHAHAYQAGRKFRLLKSFHPEDYQTLQQASPGTPMVYRHHILKGHQGAFIDRAGISPSEADKAADEYILQFADSVNQHMGTDDNGLKFCGSLNEEYPTHNPEKLHKAVEFDRAFVRRLKVHCPGARPVVFTAAVGNPDHDEYGALVELARETQAADGAFGYHGYWTVYEGHSFAASAQHQRDLHMRWDVIDRYLMQRGIRVKWMIGEAGATKGDASGYNPDVIEGWRHSNVWGGNENAYMADLQIIDGLAAQTIAAQEGRLMGIALFTSRPGDGGTWQHFNIKGSMLWKIAGHVASKDPVVVTPPPPPPPDPEPDPEPEPRKYHRTAHLLPQDATLNEMEAVLHAAYGERQTVLFSADDAFSKPPEITGRTVYVWEVERVAGSEKALKDWVNVHFPPWPTRSRFRRIKDLFVADRWDAPVGTKAERAGDKMPPGDWVVSTEFNQRYQIVSGGSFHRHSGWDLNNQSPYWDSDRNMPIRACANGRVIHMVEFPDSSSWGKVIITEHVKPDGQVVHSRHAHMAEFAEGLEVGHWVRRGTLLGTTGRTNVPNGAYHHHWDISTSGVLVNDPGHWCFDSSGCVAAHYVNPGLFVQANR